MPENNALLLYAQPLPSGSAFIVGDRESLIRIRNGIDAALRDTEGSAKVAFPERGRELYHVVIGIASVHEINNLRVPFTVSAYASRKGLDPMDVESIRPLFPVER